MLPATSFTAFQSLVSVLKGEQYLGDPTLWAQAHSWARAWGAMHTAGPAAADRFPKP
jgi:hypothetical protein